MPDRLFQVTDRCPIERIVEAFREQLSGWAIEYIGGEPFILRDFVRLNAELTKANLIGIYTNLSLINPIRSFMEQIDPARVTFINCALHPRERIRHDPDFEHFVNLYQMLQKRGFRTVVTYVVHPTVISRFDADIRLFSSIGIKVYLKVFRGVFQGRNYPEAYDQGVLECIEQHEPAMTRGRPVRSDVTGEATICRAGQLLLDMDIDGNVYRCLTERTLYRGCLGNLFRGTLRLLNTPRVCRSGVCISTRQGMGFACSDVRDFTTPAPFFFNQRM